MFLLVYFKYLKLDFFIIFFNMYRSRQCRYGPSCHYLSEGTCWFYHPPQHSFPINRSSRSSQRNTYGLSTTSLFGSSSRYTEPRQTNDNGFTSFSLQRRERQDYQFLLEMLKSLSILRSTRQTQKNIQKIDQKSNEQKMITINGKLVKCININSTLKGSKKWFFQNGNHFKYFKQCGYDQCSICLTKFSKDQQTSLLFCKHAFHQECIEKWLNTSTNCPLCRHDFTKHEEFKSMKGYSKQISSINTNFFFQQD